MRRRLALLALAAALGLAGCSEGDAERAVEDAKDTVASATDGVNVPEVKLPEVDWKKHGRDVKRRLDGLAERADCPALRKELAKAEPNDSELTRYIKAQLRQAC